MDFGPEDFDFVVEDSEATIHFVARLEHLSKDKVDLREKEK